MAQQHEEFERPFGQRATYTVMRQVFRLTGIFGYGVRCHGRENFPQTGGALVCANHQSNLDPPLVGMMSNRRMNYLAKKTLFETQPFKWWIEHLDAIPIDRQGLGLGGIKETMRRLKRGEIVLMFPEGQRTWDGEMIPLMPGFCAMARRTGVPLVPVGFDGAFRAWRRGARVPGFSRIRMVVGQPITRDDYSELDDEAMVGLLESRMRDCFEQARQHLRASLRTPCVGSRRQLNPP